MHIPVRVRSKQLLKDAPPGVQLLALVRDVSHPEEQVEHGLASHERVGVDLLERLAGLRKCVR